MADEIVTKETLYEGSGLPLAPDSDNLDGGGTTYYDQYILGQFMSSLAGAGCALPPHGGKARDKALRKLADDNESLQAILFTVGLLLYNLGNSIRVVPTNGAIQSHKSLSTYYSSVLADGLNTELDKFINDFLVCDNGGFLFIEDGTSPYHEPMSGPAIGLRHLDSLRCTRTRNKTYPCVYNDPGAGIDYPIHVSRIIMLAAWQSPDWQKNGIGHSPVSRLNKLMMHQDDVIVESLERLGSLESSKIIHATASSEKELTSAFVVAETASTNEGRKRSGKNVLLASRDPNAKLNLLNLKSGDTGSDKVADIEMTLALAALAIGVSTFTLLESTQSSSTRGAATQSIKQTDSKLLAYFYNKLTAELTAKFIPQSLKVTQAGEDKDLDGTKARIALNRATTSKQNIEAGVTTTRIEREKLVSLGELTQAQFETLELEDERLSNGLHISTLFYDDSWTDTKWLSFTTTSDPLHEEYSEEFEAEINEKIATVVSALNRSISSNISSKLMQALYALQWLENNLHNPDDDIDVVEVDNDTGNGSTPIDNSDSTSVEGEQDLSPRDDDMGGDEDRDQSEENARLDKNVEGDWLLEALRGDLTYEYSYPVTKEPTRRFQSAIRSVARGLWSGDLTESQFKTNLNGALTNQLTTAYEKEYGKLYSGSPSKNNLNALLDRSEEYISGFADYVSANKKGVGKLSDVNSRVDLWLSLYDETVNLAKLDENGDDDVELVWRLGSTDESCDTCLTYANTIKSRSEWATLADDGIKPQGRSLDCSGYKCQCSMQEL